MCPADITASTDPFSACEAYVEIDPAEITGDCDLQTLVNDYNGTTNASDVYPLGETEVCFDILSNAGAPNQCCFTVTVEDNTAPVFTSCPADMTIELDAGECEAALTFDITAVDECNLQDFQMHQNGGLTLDPSNFTTNAVGLAGGGVVCGFVTEPVGYGRLFDLENEVGVSPSSDFTVQQVEYVTNFNSPANPVTTNIYAFPDGTTVPTMAAQTLIATFTTTHPVSFGNTLHTIAISGIIPAGQELFVAQEAASDVFGGTIFASEGGPFAGAPELAPSYVFGCPSLGLFPDYTDVDGFFPQYSHMIQVTGATLDPEVPTIADPGNQFASGDAFPIGGPYCLLYTAIDLSGNSSTCEFCVTVNEFDSPTGSLTCNDHVNISLDENCESLVGADDILEGGPYGCYDNYTVNLFYDSGLTQPVPTSPLLTSQNIGQTLYVQVVDPNSSQGNSCWGTLFVEDKIIPALECNNYSIGCNDDDLPGSEYNASDDLVIPGVQSVDNATVMESADYSGAATAVITDVNVSIETNHTWVGDLQLTIQSPSGAQVLLLDNWNNAGICGGCAGDGLDVTFDDDATATQADLGATCMNNPAAAGDFQPVNPLSVFNGEDPNGTWTIIVGDVCGGDAGTVNATVHISTSGNTIPYPVPEGVTVIGNDQPYTLLGFDPCGPATLTYEDEEEEGDCVNDDYIKKIYRTWTAVDQSGNSTSCTDTITIGRSTIDDIEFPTNKDGIEDDYILCTDGDVSPDNTGWPTINGQPVQNGGDCEFAVDWDDQIIPICEGTYKIIRTWTVLAWCPTTEIANDVQIIKVVDDQGPSLTCPDDMVVSTGQTDCTASVILPAPSISDACSDANSYEIEVSQGLLVGNTLYGLPLGITTVTYTASDACGNEATCTFQILVEDEVPPVAICESYHAVALTINEPTLVPAIVFDDGSYDNCGPVTFEVRRMDNPNCPGNDATPFGDYVPFYCCDVGLDAAGDPLTVMVELRVRDAANNTNSCMVEVEVQDKLNPAILCPPDKVLDCYDDPYDLDVTGYATATDNCSAVVTHIDQGSIGQLW